METDSSPKPITRNELKELKQLNDKAKSQLLNSNEMERQRELTEKLQKKKEDDDRVKQLQEEAEQKKVAAKQKKAADRAELERKIQEQLNSLQIIDIELNELEDDSTDTLVGGQSQSSNLFGQTRVIYDTQEKILDVIEQREVQLRGDRPNVKIEPKLSLELRKQEDGWRDWSYVLVSALEHYDMAELIKIDFNPVTRSSTRFKRYDQAVKRLMGVNLKGELRDTVERESETAYQMYRRLKSTFEGNDVTKTVKTVRAFLDTLISFKDMPTFVKNFENMVDMFTQMFSGNVPIETVWKTFFLAALPTNYGSLRMTLTINKSLNLKEYINLALQSHAMDKAKAQANDMVINNVQHDKSKAKYPQSFQKKGNQQYKGDGKSVVCWVCGGDHKARNCPNKNDGSQKRDDKPANSKQNGSELRGSSGNRSNYHHNNGFKNGNFDYRNASKTSNENGSKSDGRFKSNNVVFQGRTVMIDEDTELEDVMPGINLISANLMYSSKVHPVLEGEFDEVNPIDLRVAGAVNVHSEENTTDHKPDLCAARVNVIMNERKSETHELEANLRSATEFEVSKFEGVLEEANQLTVAKDDPNKTLGLEGDSERIRKCEKTARVCSVQMEFGMKMAIYMDSGATEHMICQPDWMYALREIFNEHIKVANGGRCEILGFGHLAIRSTITDSVLNLQDCIVCPELQASFLSHSRLAKNAGIHVTTTETRVLLIHKGRLIMDGVLEDSGLYRLNFTRETPPIANLAYIRLLTNEEKVMYYHETFAHVNFQNLKLLDEKLGTNTNTNQDCYTCVKAKIKELPFKSGEIKSTRPLQLVHTDLSGSINIPNRHRFRYFILLIDDYSRFRVAELLRTKDEAFQAFKKFRTTFETQLERKLLVLRSDHGGEFKNIDFDGECEKTGMVQQFTVRGTPQQNGVAERGMGSVKQMARTILLEAKLGASFWPFAVLFAVFIQNRLPCSAVDHKIPFELFYGKSVNLRNIRKFGQRVIYRDNTETVFDAPGQDGIFLGYPTGIKGFYVYSIPKRSVIIRRCVRFLNASPNDNKKFEDDEIDEFIDLQDNELYDEVDEELNVKLCDSRQMEVVPDLNGDESIETVERPLKASSAAGEQSNKPTDDKPDQPDDDNRGAHKAADRYEPVKRVDRKSNKASDQTSYQQDQNGEVVLSRIEFREFIRQNPDVNIVRVSSCPKRGKSHYRINSISAPRSLKQAYESEHAEDWKQSTASEMASHETNGTWTLVPRPAGVTVLPVMWLFTIKLCITGLIDRFKARLVVLGNKAKIGRDYAETFAPVINELTFRLVLSYAVQYGMHLHQIDIKTAYLNAPVKGNVYVAQPPGYITKGKESWVYKLNKALYGLRESAHQWYVMLYQVLCGMGFKRSLSDQCLYYGIFGGELVILAIYVDDCLIACRDIKVMGQIKSMLRKEFDLTDKGPVNHFLNLDIQYNVDAGVLYMSQRHYVNQLLEFTNMSNCNGAKTPCVPGTDLFTTEGEAFSDIAWYQSVMGRLIYLATHSRPDISFTVSRLCAFMHNPTVNHANHIKRLLRYLKHTKGYRLVYKKNKIEASVYCDADYGNDQHSSKSITGVCCFVFNNLVDWYSRKQRRVATSTCQAEIYALVDGTMEAEFVFNVLKELSVEIKNITVYNDNESARLTVAECGDFAKNKNYRTSINSIREVVQMGWLRVVHCASEDMLADFLTKPMTESKLNGLVRRTGMEMRRDDFSE